MGLDLTSRESCLTYEPNYYFKQIAFDSIEFHSLFLYIDNVTEESSKCMFSFHNNTQYTRYNTRYLILN